MAGLWYGSQLLRSVSIVLLTTVWRSGWRVFAVACVTYVVAQLTEAAATFALQTMLGGATRTWPMSVAVGLLTAFASGLVGARYRRESSIVLAMRTAVTVGALLWLTPDSAPPWYQIIGRGTLPGDVPSSMSRPVCAYPAVARYRGSGDIADAASFVCERR